MSNKEYAPKLIGIVGGKESTRATMAQEMIKTNAVSRPIGLNTAFEQIVDESLRNAEYPVELTEVQIKRFISKMTKGVHAVRLAGTTLSNREEALLFFHKYAERMCGAGWLEKDFKDTIDYAPKGVYVVYDITPTQAMTIKSLLKNDCMLINVMGGEEDGVLGADVVINEPKTKAEIKNEAKEALKQLISKWRKYGNETRSVL